MSFLKSSVSDFFGEKVHLLDWHLVEILFTWNKHQILSSLRFGKLLSASTWMLCCFEKMCDAICSVV